MDAGDVMSVMLAGALGRSGRKRSRRARRFLTGHAGFLTASTLMTAAGLAWGVYDSLQGTQAAPAGAAGTAGGPPPLPGVPPPIPGAPAGSGASAVSPDLVRLVRLSVSAARADGVLTPAERAAIIARAREAGVEPLVAEEIDRPAPLAAIVAGVTDARQREELYVLAFTIVRADEAVTGAERIYLAQLAHHLGLDAETSGRLERETAAAIDSTPES